MHAIDELLSSLPGPYVVAELDRYRLVAGPSGAFVLTSDADDPCEPATSLLQMAAVTRRCLSDHLTWVPFLDPLLVVGDGGIPHHEVTAVPTDLLYEVLVADRPLLDRETLDRLTELIDEGRLVLRANDARMQGCDPSPRPMAWRSRSTISAVGVNPSSSPTPPGSTVASGHPSPGI
ncbi:hypothetical protein BH24ACT3_BH24ACT3_07970 [soil metagenome]